MTNPVEQFKHAMVNAGLIPPRSIIPGAFHRFPGIGKKSDDNAGWCKLFEDQQGGVFGDFSSDFDDHWRADGWEKLSSTQQEAFRQRCEAERKQRLLEQQKLHDTNAIKAKGILNAANMDVKTHLYAILKKVSLGNHIKRGSWAQCGWTDALIIPLYDKAGKICTLQAINTDGTKNFLKGGRKKGCFYPFGQIRNADKVLIGEGIATVAAVHSATNIPAVAAMDASNLMHVALAIRELAPNAAIILLADNDINTNDENVGIQAATKAAKAVSGYMAIPELNGQKCDFWDVWHSQGDNAINCIIKSAVQKSAPTDLAHQYLEPIPLPKLPLVEPFPMEILPDILKPWLIDAAERAQFPIDFVAVVSMVALGSLIGRSIGVRLKQHDDWVEYANIWGIVVGSPSTLKSPAMREAMCFLKELQDIANEEYNENVKKYTMELELYKLKKKNQKQVSIDSILLPPDEPIAQTYWTSDATAEKLGELLAANTNGLLVERDELSSLLTSLEDERNATARGLYLSGWSGKESYRFDRISRGTIHVPKFSLSLVGGIQPGPLTKYVRQAFSGKHADGLLQRFQLAVWPDTSKFNYVDRAPNYEVKRSVKELFEKIAALAKSRATVPSITLRLSPSAQSIFTEWYEEFMMTRQQNEQNGGEHPALSAHFGKYTGLVGKLAVIIHMADDFNAQQISEVTISKALSWIKYLTSHAQRIYHAVEYPEIHTAELLLSRLKSGELPSQFKPWQITRKGWHCLKDSKAIKIACRILFEHGWLIEVPIDSSKSIGRTPDPTYAISPLVQVKS